MAEKQLLSIQQVIARAQKGGSFVTESGIEITAAVESGGVRYSNSLNPSQVPMTQSVFLQMFRSRLFTEGASESERPKRKKKSNSESE